MALTIEGKEYLKQGLGRLFLSVVSAFLFLYSTDHSGKRVDSGDLTSIKGALFEQPRIQKIYSKADGWETTLPIKLRENSELNFEIEGGDAFNSTAYQSYLKDVRQGDTVTLSVLTKSYEHSVKPKLAPYNKIFPRQIAVYGLNFKHKQYFNLDDYNKKVISKDNHPILYVTGIFAFVLFINSIWYIALARK